jgi:predicted lipoprotein with Yx(FWY)xxD motif
MFRTRVAVLAATAAAGLLAITACGELNGSAQPDSDALRPLPVVDDGEVAPGITLSSAEVAKLGEVVTDQHGRTLYRSEKDKASPSVSNCTGDCATKWPPVIVDDPAAVKLDDIDKSLVGTVARADGTQQLTLAGYPLYRFVKDSRAGDINGQGVDGTWFASTPQGKKAREVKKPDPPAGSGGGGYGYR